MQNLRLIVTQYVEAFIPADGSLKVLLTDDETIPIISLCLSQTQLLHRGVFLVDKLQEKNRQNLLSMRCVIFVRPTKENAQLIAEELELKRYHSYSIIFSNSANPELLDSIARSDRTESVTQISEHFADYLVINSDFFTVPIRGAPVTTSVLTSTEFFRSASGIASLMVSLRRKPMIRFQKSSNFARQVSSELFSLMRADTELFDFRNPGTLLLIIDRCEDPVTPLLTPWTYQAMLHELVGMTDNTITLPPEENKQQSTPDQPMSFCFSDADDKFFASNMYANWGDLCTTVKEYVDHCKKVLNIDRSTATIQEVKQFIQKLPQTKSLTGSVTKHATVVSYLSQLIKKQNLLEISLLEQDIVATINQADHFARLSELVKKSTPDHVLRLCMLYNLRYEKVASPSRTDPFLNPQQKILLRKLREYYGEQRSTDVLFGTASGMVGSVISFVKGLSDVENIYTQHEPVLKKQLLSAVQGKLDPEAFPYLVQPPAAGQTSTKLKEIIVFVCGGVTLEEAALVHTLNTSMSIKDPAAAALLNTKVFLGGTALLNSRIFLEALSAKP